MMYIHIRNKIMLGLLNIVEEIKKSALCFLIWRLYKMRFSIKKHYPTYAPGESTRDNDKIRVKTVFCPLKNSY